MPQKDKDGKELPKKVTIERQFDPKKLVSYVNNPKFSLVEQRRELDLLQKLEKMREEQTGTDPQVEAVIKSMEVAYGCRPKPPDVFDVRKESQATLDLYGPGPVARGCLTAVPIGGEGRAHDAGLLFAGRSVDAHGDIFAHKTNAKNSDQGIRRGSQGSEEPWVVKDTLVVCGSEFGRTPVREVGGAGQGVKRGRDHNPFGFTMWLAGGAVKGRHDLWRHR
ncbi:MAG: DUF1501 domain-containing protein [Ignavibacteriota bacterium]